MPNCSLVDNTLPHVFFFFLSSHVSRVCRGDLPRRFTRTKSMSPCSLHRNSIFCVPPHVCPDKTDANLKSSRQSVILSCPTPCLPKQPTARSMYDAMPDENAPHRRIDYLEQEQEQERRRRDDKQKDRPKSKPKPNPLDSSSLRALSDKGPNINRNLRVWWRYVVEIQR